MYLLLTYNVSAQLHDVAILVHLRGIYESNISLLSLSGGKVFKPIVEVKGIKNGELARLIVLKDYLPGEFVLRFDYKEKNTSSPYPSEKNIYINQQDLELWVNPMFSNKADSTWFQKDETENAAFVLFSSENGKQKEKLGLLQNFLLNYDDQKSKFYKEGITEYEKRRNNYNVWIANRWQQDKSLFVSSLYHFQYVPQIPWEGNETDRMKSLINHYFDGIDFNDPQMVKTSQMNKWMDTYVNLNGQLCTTQALRDSLIPAAGKKAIEKARLGHPLVYGWMVDYFYRGFESNNIPAGMKVLEPYLDDPDCLTTKRLEIEKRLKGMKTLVPGSRAPEIAMNDTEGNKFELSTFYAGTNYLLLIFWSAGCSHCMEMVEKLYPWQQQPEIGEKMKVIAINLDETEPEIKAWEKQLETLKGWKHLHAADGVRSKVAGDYFVLATPVMVLIDAKAKTIVSLPDNPEELKKAIQ